MLQVRKGTESSASEKSGRHQEHLPVAYDSQLTGCPIHCPSQAVRGGLQSAHCRQRRAIVEMSATGCGTVVQLSSESFLCRQREYSTQKIAKVLIYGCFVVHTWSLPATFDWGTCEGPVA